MKIERVSPILPVRDVAAALQRYKGLGFEGTVYGEVDGQGRPFYAFLRRDDITIHLALAPDLDQHANTSAVYLYVDDPDALYKEWRDALPSGDLRPPVDTNWGMREMSYGDVDGNLLRIGRRL
jgi:catechol 2,3-dioxygenase-like lactoylglutathione lyase family enzyme